MLSPGRTSILSNARTLLLNRRYSSSIAVTSRSNVFAKIHKNFLRSNVDTLAQAFLCMQRGLRTKVKTFDAKPSDSSSNASEHKSESFEAEAEKKLDKILANPGQFGSYQEYRKAYLAAKKEFAGSNPFCQKLFKLEEKFIPENETVLFIVVSLILVLAVYLAYKLVRRVWSQFKSAPSKTKSLSNAPSIPAIESDFEKKELKNEFDLNALLQTAADSDSGKQQSYGEFK